MSVEYDGGLIRFTCDGAQCHRNTESDEKFSVAWRLAKEDGWVNCASNGVWVHYCHECKKELGD